MKSKPLKRRIRSWKRQLRVWSYRNDNILSEADSHQQIRDGILSGKPIAIGKIGSVELLGLKHWLQYGKNTRALATPEGKRVCYKLYKNAGVFPESPATYERFCQTFTANLQQMDLLAPWFLTGERKILKEYASQAQLISTAPLYLHPIGSEEPNHWTQSLQNKTILVVSPFTATIEAQHARRKAIWTGAHPLLPECTLKTLRVPLAASIAASPFPDWPTGLATLQSKMNDIDFDVAIIGAGAWSIPLAAHAKSIHKIGIHLGGATQLLFGIKGNRWEKGGEPDYYNSAWVRPNASETPNGVNKIESGCYW